MQRPANYHFSYGVSDPTTGDHKHHWEKRQGDHVVGEYGLLEPDGATRIVQYTAGPHQGFKAVVTRIENTHLVPNDYTTGHALYGAHRPGLYNEGNVVQFGQPHQVAISPQPHPEYDRSSENNQYFLNQYAGHYQSSDVPQELHQGVHLSEQTHSTLQPYQQDHNVQIQNSYSTLQHQPNYDDYRVEHRESNLPQHVIDNINNQYGGADQANLEPRGFAHHFENNADIAQTINALQETGHNQQVFVSSTEPSAHHIPQDHHIGYISSTAPNIQHVQQNYVSSTPSPIQHNYVSSPSPIEHNYVSSSSPVEHNYVSSTPSPIEHNYVSSTPSPIQHNYVSSPAPIQHNYVSSTESPLQQNYVSSSQAPLQHEDYVSSTVPTVQQNYVTSTESPVGYVSSTPAPIAYQNGYAQQNYPTDVQIIPNGHNSIPEQVPNIQVTTPKSNINPLLMNLMNYLKNNMPTQYKDRFESMFQPFINTPVGKIAPVFNEGFSSTTPGSIPVSPVVSVTQNPIPAYVTDPNLHGLVNTDDPEASKKDYAQNPYLTGEVRVGQISPDYLAAGVTPTPDYNNNPPLQNGGYQQQQLHQTVDAQYNYQNLGQVAQDRSDQGYEHLQQDYRGDSNNYDNNNNARKVYYELDPAAYESRYHQNVQRDTSSQQQGRDGSVFVVRNENGRNLQTPNFYQPMNPNAYPDNPNPYLNYDQAGGATNNDFIWNAGDYTAPRDPEILVRQLNQTCASFRFNTTNDYEQKDQDAHIWNSGDYTALRAEEQLIRSINITCDNFTNDYTNNFTSGFSLWHYCSQCLNSDAQDVNEVQREVIVGLDGQPQEFIYSKSQVEQIANSNPQNDYSYQDQRSNGEIAGLVKVVNPNFNQQDYQNKPQGTLNNFATLLSNFNLEVNKRKPIYVPNYEDEEYDYPENGNGVYKRNTQGSNQKLVVRVRKQ